LFDRAVELGYRAPSALAEIAATSWRRPGTPWLSPRKQAFLDRLYFYSIFIDGKVAFYRPDAISRLVARLLRPIARLRLRRRFFAVPIEKWLFERVAGEDY
jgi:hypothetical protein